MTTERDIIIIKILLEHGVDINSKNEDGETLLHKAVFNSDEEMITFLLENGIDINSKNEDGETALHCCATSEASEAAVIICIW